MALLGPRALDIEAAVLLPFLGEVNAGYVRRI